MGPVAALGCADDRCVWAHTTSLVEGLLFVVIGALFLRYDGTAGITGVLGLGDTTDLEVNAQAAVTRWFGAVSVPVVAAGVAVVASIVAMRRTREHQPQTTSDTERQESRS